MGDGVLASMAASVASGVDVVFLDTGYHFPETIGTRDAVAHVYDVNVRTVLPLLTVTQQDAEHGAELWRRNPDACCAMRKVEPLTPGAGRLRRLRLRASAATSRRPAPTTAVVEWDDKRGKVKVNPLVAWTQDDVDAYVTDNDILVNPLAEDGYPSIGCAPVHLPGRAGRGPALRPLEGLAEDRVRSARLSNPACMEPPGAGRSQHPCGFRSWRLVEGVEDVSLQGVAVDDPRVVELAVRGACRSAPSPLGSGSVGERRDADDLVDVREADLEGCPGSLASRSRGPRPSAASRQPTSRSAPPMTSVHRSPVKPAKRPSTSTAHRP